MKLLSHVRFQERKSTRGDLIDNGTGFLSYTIMTQCRSSEFILGLGHDSKESEVKG